MSSARIGPGVRERQDKHNNDTGLPYHDRPAQPSQERPGHPTFLIFSHEVLRDGNVIAAMNTKNILMTNNVTYANNKKNLSSTMGMS